jgi:hypothetical protein
MYAKCFISFEPYVPFSFESYSYVVFLVRGRIPWCGVRVEIP